MTAYNTVIGISPKKRSAISIASQYTAQVAYYPLITRLVV